MNNLIKNIFHKFFKDNPSELKTKALERASNLSKPRVGTPHDWEDYENYLKNLENEDHEVN